MIQFLLPLKQIHGTWIQVCNESSITFLKKFRKSHTRQAQLMFCINLKINPAKPVVGHDERMLSRFSAG